MSYVRVVPTFYSYTKLLTTTETAYGKRMARLRNSIFGDPVRPSQQTSKNLNVIKVISREPIHKREIYTQWYPRHTETHTLIMALRGYGLFRDEHEDFKEEMVRLRTLRGKPPWQPPKDKKKKK